jgi:phosphatidylcholine synthase
MAWGVHAFTASGALAGVAALLCISAGEFHTAILWMLLALFIDAVDGMLARAVGVSQVLPSFDGRRLDDMVDFFNYVLVPAVFLVSADLVVHWSLVVPPIMASAYGFSQLDAKTEDNFFLGFPSYWNILAIYLWFLQLHPVAGSIWVLALSILVFVPLKYLYPSRMQVLWRTNAALSTICILLIGYAAFDPVHAKALYLIEASLLYPAFYFTLSFWLGGIHRTSKDSAQGVQS